VEPYTAAARVAVAPYAARVSAVVQSGVTAAKPAVVASRAALSTYVFPRFFINFFVLVQEKKQQLHAH
jgi:hypothetical protein